MLNEIINQQNVKCIGGFIGIYTDAAVMANLNPGNMYKNNIVVIIKNDKTIWATRIIQNDINQNKTEWAEITKENIFMKF